jgi:hypothetical protein
VRKQYHFRPGDRGLNAWDVDRLIQLSTDLPIIDVPVDAIIEIDEDYWYNHGYRPTVRSVAEHARLIAEVDTDWPIILSDEGRVMDGMHRVARALRDGTLTVRAVRFTDPILPDYENCRPDELPYS